MRFTVVLGVVPVVAASHFPEMTSGVRAGLMGFGLSLLVTLLLDAIKKAGEQNG